MSVVCEAFRHLLEECVGDTEETVIVDVELVGYGHEDILCRRSVGLWHGSEREDK